MKVLIICSGNVENFDIKIHQAFIYEQAETISKCGLEMDFFAIKGKGLFGYLSNLKKLKNKIEKFEPDILHAHYGLSGLLVSIVKNNHPLVTTFHGNDVNPIISDGKENNFNRLLSKIASWNSDYLIYVNSDFATRINSNQKKYAVVPCHVDLDIFYPIDKINARNQLGFTDEKKYILFSSAFDEPIKNYPLAAYATMNVKNVNVIELKGYRRYEVNLLLNACDIALLTSLNEGSPQFIKEAMACNCPIVSTDVGDIKWVIGETDGCFLTSFERDDVTEKINLALDFVQKSDRTNGRERILSLGLDSETTAKKIITMYKQLLNS